MTFSVFMIFFIRIKDEDFQSIVYSQFLRDKIFFTKMYIYFKKMSQSFKIVLGVFMTFPGLEITLLKLKPHTVYYWL